VAEPAWALLIPPENVARGERAFGPTDRCPVLKKGTGTSRQPFAVRASQPVARSQSPFSAPPSACKRSVRHASLPPAPLRWAAAAAIAATRAGPSTVVEKGDRHLVVTCKRPENLSGARSQSPFSTLSIRPVARVEAGEYGNRRGGSRAVSGRFFAYSWQRKTGALRHRHGPAWQGHLARVGPFHGLEARATAPSRPMALTSLLRQQLPNRTPLAVARRSDTVSCGQIEIPGRASTCPCCAALSRPSRGGGRLR